MKKGMLVAVLLVVLVFGFYFVSATPSPTTANYPTTYNTSSYVVFNGTPNNNSAMVNYSLYGNWSGSWVANQTNTSTLGWRTPPTPLRMNASLPDGVYLWAFRVCDSTGCNFSANNTFVIDSTIPNLTVEITSSYNPQNSSANWVYFNATTTDATSGVKSINASIYKLFLYQNCGASYINMNGFNGPESYPLSFVNTLGSSALINYTNLAQGYYILNATAYDYAGNSKTYFETSVGASDMNRSYFLYATNAKLDNTPPSLSISSPTNGTNVNQGDTLKIYFDASENTAILSDSKGALDYYWLSNDHTDSNSTACSYSASPISISTANWNSGQHTLVLYVSDPAGNINASTVTVNIVSNSSSSTTTTSGGSGGGGTATSLFSTSSSNQPVTVNIVNSSITQLQITSNKTTSNASVTVTETQSAPKVDSSSKIYQSFDISLGGIDDTEIINVTINFKINRTWISTNNRDPLNVTLYRNTGTNSSPAWNPLSTNLTREDSQYYYYQTVSPGFSEYSVAVGTSSCNSGEFRCLVDSVQQCGSDNLWATIKTCSAGCSEGKCVEGGALGTVKNLFVGNLLYYILVTVIIGLILVVVYLVSKKVKRR